MWRLAKVLPLVVLFSLLLLSCSSKPKVCTTCNGTGKISQSQEIPIPFEIKTFEVTDRGIFNPDYYANVTLENKGDEGGTFEISVDFFYKDIGTHTETSDLYVAAHSSASKEIHYDADNRSDKRECRVKPPMVVHTTQVICPTCGGKGVI